jgi:glycolate oxidase
VRLAKDDAEAELLWRIRRSMHRDRDARDDAHRGRLGAAQRLPAMFDEIARIERAYDLVIPTVCHAGDGNLHPNFVYDAAAGADARDGCPTSSGRRRTTSSAALRLGGTLTGEHGVGVLKRRWLVDELGEDQWELQRQIARVFDPAGIMNPGKVFTR